MSKSFYYLFGSLFFVLGVFVLGTVKAEAASVEPFPVFRVGRSTDQTVTANTSTIIDFNTETINSGNFDLSTDKFIPNQAGLYLFNVVLRCAGTNNIGCFVRIKKNGINSVQGTGGPISSVFVSGVSASDILYLNGINDYVEVEVFNSQGNLVHSGANLSFSGSLIISSSTNMTINNPTLDLFLGILLFYLVGFFVMWIFKKR